MMRRFTWRTRVQKRSLMVRDCRRTIRELLALIRWYVEENERLQKEIHRLRAENEELRPLAIDALSGCLSRDRFENDAARLIASVYNEGGRIVVLVFDLDDFKLVNDTYGHAMGDTVLRLFGKAVRDALRVGDAVGRLGGDEFVAVLPDACLNDVRQILRRIKSEFKRLWKTTVSERLGATPIGFSVGAAAGTARQGLSYEELKNIADHHMYVSKGDKGRTS